MKIAAFQGPCHDGDVAANLATATATLHQASEAGADFLLMPEGYLGGYGSREIVESTAMTLDDPRIEGLVAETAGRDIVFMVGLNERSGERIYNSELIAHRGALLGVYRKTMLTRGGHRQMGFATDFDLPVWEAKGITFGVIICADSSFIEVAQAMWWQGAQVIFSPHYNFIPSEGMDAHRIRVRNNHIGIAALLGVPVVRSNVVNWDRAPRLGYGDTAIFDDSGRPLAEAGLFTQTLITADIDLSSLRPRQLRHRVPMEARRQLADAMLSAPVAEF